MLLFMFLTWNERILFAVLAVICTDGGVFTPAAGKEVEFSDVAIDEA
jgi:hypothetical protein